MVEPLGASFCALPPGVPGRFTERGCTDDKQMMILSVLTAAREMSRFALLPQSPVRSDELRIRSELEADGR